MRRIFILFFFTLVLFLAKATSEYPFIRLEVADGLSNNSVNAIYKDSEGFIWISTAFGLNRYDGYNFRVYKNVDNDSTSIPNSSVGRVIESGAGLLWVKTDNGYVMFDKRKDCFVRDITPFMAKMGSRGVPTLIYADRKGDTWFFVEKEGCYRQRGGEETFDFLPLTTEGMPRTEVIGLSECSEGLLLLAEDGSLVCISREELSVRWTNSQIRERWHGTSSEVLSFFVDTDDCLWISDIKNLWAYDLKNDRWCEKWMNLIQKPDMVHDITQDSKGQIWLATDFNGIILLDKQTEQTINLRANPDDERSLPHNTIYALYTDPDGLMWVGTYKKGVACYSESAFKFSMNNLGDITCAVESEDDGSLWLGTNDQGLLLWNPVSGSRRYYNTGNSPLKSNAIVALLHDREGRLWIGSFGGGLAYMDKGKIYAFPLRTADDLPKTSLNNIWALDEDADGRIWIATLGGGLRCYDPGTKELKVFNRANSALTDDYIASIHVVDGQSLVIGTSSRGVCLMDSRTNVIVNLEDDVQVGSSLSNSRINQVFRDSRGLIWIATREGLNVYDERQRAFLDLSELTPLRDEIIAGVTEDTRGGMWIASTRKVYNINVVNDNNRHYRLFQAHVYDNWDGLQNCDFNLRSMRSLESGQIIIGGLYGINRFDPTNIVYNKKAPHVMFSSISLFEKELRVGEEYDGQVILDEAPNNMDCLDLSYRHKIFQVEFASDNYTLPSKTTYQYQLEGFNDNWLELTPGLHGVTFTNLSPGSYLLRVRASSSDGYTDHGEATLRVKINPPFWLTGWAYAFYSLVALGLLFLSHHLLIRNERRKYELRRIEQEIAKNEEINQMKFRFFTNISHELRTPLTLIITPLEGILQEETDGRKKEKLSLIYRNARRLLILVNQLLDFRKGEIEGHRLSLSEGDLVGFVRDTCDSFLPWADKKSIQFNFFAAPDRLMMAFDSDKINKIIMNLLSNAFKYTPDKGHVSVFVEKINEEWTEIRVVDTGIGIPESEKSRIFDRFYQVDQRREMESTGTGIGLSLVNDFVRLHEGTVNVYDNPGQGTIFVIALPIRHVETISLPKKEAMMGDMATQSEDALVEDGACQTKPIVLVVDDNPDFRTFMRDSLELQFQVRLAANGKEAWEMMEQALPDIVVSDVMMPEMDGNELCRLIKQDKRTKRIPVILLTARQSTEQQKEGLTIADDYVTKPFHLELLILRMRKLVERNKVDKGGMSERIDPAPKEIEITPLDEKLIERAILYVEENLSRSDLSVESLSRELGMSRVHLYKKLLQITGKTPIEFIRVIRLKRAAQLLRESQMHISEIAFEVGFNNPKYFSRYFKEEFGMLPSVYQDRYGK